MGNLNPGGSRNKHGGRVYGDKAIKHVVQHAKPDHGAAGVNSIAGKPHEHSREAQRRRRQLERQRAK